jgi:hypothetical protein
VGCYLKCFLLYINNNHKMDNIFGITNGADLLFVTNTEGGGGGSVPVDLTAITGISYTVTNGVPLTTINQNLSVTGNLSFTGNLTANKNSLNILITFGANNAGGQSKPNGSSNMQMSFQKLANITTVTWSTVSTRITNAPVQGSIGPGIAIVLPSINYNPNREINGFYLSSVNTGSKVIASFKISTSGIMTFFQSVNQTSAFNVNDTAFVYGGCVSYINS